MTIAVGVKPWSASAASTASNTLVSPVLGRRWVASQNASSPNPTVPMTSSARSWPSRVIFSSDEAPSAVGYSGTGGLLAQPLAQLRAVLVELGWW